MRAHQQADEGIARLVAKEFEVVKAASAQSWSAAPASRA
jgi:hypothetical protein